MARQLTKKQTGRWAKQAGKTRVRNLLIHAWPIWEHPLAIVVYVDREPVAMTQAAQGVLRADSRTDMRRVPLWGEPLNMFAVDDETPPKWGHHRRVSAAFLGEPEWPVTFNNLDPGLCSMLSAVFTPRLAGWAVCAVMDAIEPSHSRPVLVDGGRVFGDPVLSEALGFGPDDVSWVPDVFREPLRPGPCEQGFSEVVSGDGVPAVLRWVRVSNGDMALYMVRLWFGPVEDLGRVSVSLSAVGFG